MAVLTLLLVDAYLRPRDAFPLTAGQLFPMAVGVSRVLAVLLQPSEFGQTGKTGESVVTVLLNSPHLQWMTAIWTALYDQPADALLFPFSYAAYTIDFKKTVQALRVPTATPCLARHSRLSFDLA